MNKKYQLHTGIKDIIQTNGTEPIRTVQLANILADYSAYDEYPATKVVLKDVLTTGYGQRIYNAFNESGKIYLAEIEMIKQDYSKKSKFKKDVVNYVFDSICYGLGLKTAVKEPSSNNFDPYINESDNILDKLPGMLAELKKEYDEALKSLLVLPKDIIWDAVAYYPASAENQLYLIEGKIHVISNQLGINDNNWCKNQKEKTLNSHRQRKVNTVKEVLDAKKIDFTNLLNTALVKPSASYISKSGHYASDKLSDIEKMESEIKGLYGEMGVKYDDWCKTEKDRILSSYIVSDSSRFRQMLLKIAMPAAMFCGVGYYGGTYAVSTDEINAYEQRMKAADGYLANGNYGKAIAGFIQASNLYDGSFRTSSYKEGALSQADVCFAKMQDQVTSLIDRKQYGQILALMNSIPTEYLAANQNKSDWIEKTKIDLQNTVAEEVDQLAEIISFNGGHLTEDGKKYLDQLLAVSPDNYWLNLIKTKEK